MMDIGKDLQDAFMDGYNYRDAEIVRCKDCKHWDDVSITEKGHECNLTNGNKYKIRIATPSDWFCPMGERRSE